MEGIKLADPDRVRAMIAREWLAAGSQRAKLGNVTLRPHQVDAAQRLASIVAAHGGALLADEVGLGKTYVALAVSRPYARRLVVAPAALRAMWRSAADQCDIAIRFISTESLSRSPPETTDAAVLIVDEAHHFRTPSTRRYRALATLVPRCPILLVSATPLHNRTSDIASLLALFLGSAAQSLTSTSLSTFVVRRGQGTLSESLPLVRPPTRIGIRSRADDLEKILALPPPVAASDGGVALAMVAHTLVRLWASSDAALREGLRRRFAKTVAMRHSLEAGCRPTRRELRDWTYSDCAVQLGFAELLSAGPIGDRDDLLPAVRAHEQALSDLIHALPSSLNSDTLRVAALRSIRGRHQSARIVAFSQFAETIRMYYRALGSSAGVAMLTSRGARIASGSVTRREALERFAPAAHGVSAPHPSQFISLLLTTDLLSEGVNLQDASVVVHLDLPWTAAGLEQRVGRVARLASPHKEVFVYAIDPPAPASKLVRAEELIRRKASLAEHSLGTSRIPPLFARVGAASASEVEDTEVIRATLTRWLCHDESHDGNAPLCAGIASDRDAVLALVSVRGELTLLGGSPPNLSNAGHAIRPIAENADGEIVPISRYTVADAIGAALQWIETRLASADAGRSGLPKSRLTRRITARLARQLADCPRHERAACSARIALLHQRLELPFTLGVEWEVESLLKSDPKDFLARLEPIVGGRTKKEEIGECQVRAVLVLCRCAASDRKTGTQAGERVTPL